MLFSDFICASSLLASEVPETRSLGPFWIMAQMRLSKHSDSVSTEGCVWGVQFTSLPRAQPRKLLVWLLEEPVSQCHESCLVGWPGRNIYV